MPRRAPQDPTADSEAALLAQLRQQLSYSYDGNRAPITIALHTPWFSAKPFHASALSAFINEAVVKPGLFFVTYAQLRAWMLYPVPVSRMQSWLTCNPVDFQAEGGRQAAGRRAGQGPRGSNSPR